MKNDDALAADPPCRCCGPHGCGAALPSRDGSVSLTRRELLADAGTLSVAGLALTTLATGAAEAGENGGTPAGERSRPGPSPFRVLPVLTYDTPSRAHATSWRSWGGIQTEKDAEKETARIGRELEEMAKKADFPLEILPLKTAKTVEQAATAMKQPHDAIVTYAAGGGGGILETLAAGGGRNLIFLRHRSGPVYLWYEIVHPHFLRKTVDAYGQPDMGPEDVVVDSSDDLLARLRALHGLKNAVGKRIVAVGGPSGWGAGGARAPERSREQWKLDIQNLSYPDLGARIEKARRNPDLVARTRADAARYLGEKGVTMKTTRSFVDNAFLLNEVFKDVMDEAKTDAITINSCMVTIMPIAETTACLPLSLLNDDGYLAFCESDFVVIPSGILLHYLSNKPVFLNDPTTPHHGVITLAHCTAPRRMDGEKLESVRIMTHFESDYGAAPKVEMRRGQTVTTLDPDFDSNRWVGFTGEITANPFMDICRSQIDVRIHGDDEQLAREMRGFHWMTCYGDYLKETGYALKKLGVGWLSLT